MQAVLKAELTDLTVCGGIKPGSFTAMHQVQFIYIFHQLCGCILADMLVQSSAKLIGDIIFSVGKSTCTAKSLHDRAGFAVDTGFYFLSVDGTFSFFQRMTCFKNRDLFLRIIIHQFIGRKDPTGTCPYDQYIILHKQKLLILYCTFSVLCFCTNPVYSTTNVFKSHRFFSVLEKNPQSFRNLPILSFFPSVSTVIAPFFMVYST